MTAKAKAGQRGSYEAVAGWCVLGPQLERFGKKVPADIITDPTKFVTMGSRALAHIGEDVVFCEECLYATELVTKRMEMAFQAILDVELRYVFSAVGFSQSYVEEYDSPHAEKVMDPQEMYLRALISLEHRLLHPREAWDFSEDSKEWWAHGYLRAIKWLKTFEEEKAMLDSNYTGSPKAISLFASNYTGSPKAILKFLAFAGYRLDADGLERVRFDDKTLHIAQRILREHIARERVQAPNQNPELLQQQVQEARHLRLVEGEKFAHLIELHHFCYNYGAPSTFQDIQRYLSAFTDLNVCSIRLEKEGEWWLQEWSEWWARWCAGEGAQFWWQDTPEIWCEACRKFKKQCDDELVGVGWTLCGEVWLDSSEDRMCLVTTCALCAQPQDSSKTEARRCNECKERGKYVPFRQQSMRCLLCEYPQCAACGVHSVERVEATSKEQETDRSGEYPGQRARWYCQRDTCQSQRPRNVSTATPKTRGWHPCTQCHLERQTKDFNLKKSGNIPDSGRCKDCEYPTCAACGKQSQKIVDPPSEKLRDYENATFPGQRCRWFCDNPRCKTQSPRKCDLCLQYREYDMFRKEKDRHTAADWMIGRPTV